VSEPTDLDCQHFTAGTRGPAGHRVFFLQAAAPGELLTVRCEKQHVAALAEHFESLLADLEPAEGVPADLIEPVEPRFVVGSIAIGYDEDIDRLVVQLHELVGEDDPPGDSVRCALGRGLAHAFIARSEELMNAGRPPCPLCGRPVGADGHTCVKTNGHFPH